MGYPHKDWMSTKNGEPYYAAYWNNAGKHQAIYEELQKLLVPAQGDADTVEGQMLRFVGNFYYDRYNNGHCNSCRTKDAARVDRYMKRHGLKGRFIINQYDWELDEAMDALVEYIKGLPSFKVRKNKS